MFMLEFPARPHRKSARLRHKFLDMEVLTVCAHLQFNPTCHGLSTVFSYSIKSFINELQLQARIIENEPIQLALIVHGSNTTYLTAFPNDASWNFVCASWIGNGGKWAIWANGTKVGSGSSLNASNHIGGDGYFIIGQEQDTFGGYKSDKALCGNITQLYMWDSVLLDSEIGNMEKDCSPVSSGLFFKWSESVLEIETSLQTRRGNSLCQGRVGGGGYGVAPYTVLTPGLYWVVSLTSSHNNFHSSIHFHPSISQVVIANLRLKWL